MEAFEGRRGDRCSTEVAEIENGFQPWKHRSTTVEMEETAVDVWFRKHVGRQDTLHAKIEWLRDKLHKHISYRYRIALCIEPERNEALVESAGITGKEQSVLAAWDTVTQPDTAPARPSSAATPVQQSQHATLARTDRRYARARCTLNSTHIKYYKNADSYNPQGEIPIESVSDVKSGRIAGLTEMNGESTDDGFVIITPERTFYFVAESNPAKFEWIQCIADEVIRFKMEGPVS